MVITISNVVSEIESHTIGGFGPSDVRMEPSKESIVVDILEAVAAERGTDPMELSPLAEDIDPEALERLVSTARVDVEVSLALYGCRISIDSTGEITAIRTADVS